MPSTHFGKVDILINGVGGGSGKSAFIDADMATFEKVLHMNLVAGLMIPTKVVADYWIKSGIRGAVINITSMASYNPLSGVWGYDAAKAATLNLTVATANEFAQHGIRVNAIAPGFFIGKQNKALLIDQGNRRIHRPRQSGDQPHPLRPLRRCRGTGRGNPVLGQQQGRRLCHRGLHSGRWRLPGPQYLNPAGRTRGQERKIKGD